MITASASDPGKYRHGHATIRAERAEGRLVLTWIGGGHCEPEGAHLDALIASTRASGDRVLWAVEEVREAFRGKHAGDLIATAKQEQSIVDHLRHRGFEPERVPAVEWRRALTGSDGPSDAAIAIVVCGLVRGAKNAPLGSAEREHAFDAAGLAVYAIVKHLGLLEVPALAKIGKSGARAAGRLTLPPQVAHALAVQLQKDSEERRRKRKAKKTREAAGLPKRRGARRAA